MIPCTKKRIFARWNFKDADLSYFIKNKIFLMKIHRVFYSAAVVSLMATAIVSCSKKNDLSDTRSNITGAEPTYYKMAKAYKPSTGEIPPNMVFIQGGTFTMGRNSDQGAQSTANSFQRRVTVNSFYMDKYAITNGNWNEYYQWARNVFHNTPSLIDRTKPNILVWREDLAYNEPYVESYFQHPAYRHYPVVGITWEQATDFCVWRTDRVNEQKLISKGYMLKPDYKAIANATSAQEVAEKYIFNTQKYNYDPQYHPAQRNSRDTTKVDPTFGVLFPSFRLPTEAEWEYAAYGVSADKKGNVDNFHIYPWSTTQLRVVSGKKKKIGKFQGNFARGRGDLMGMGTNTDGGMIPVAVNSYQPNNFGLYNMGGNVNEWVLDVYRPLNQQDVEEYNPFRGNEYEPYPGYNLPKTAGGTEVKFVVDSLGRLRPQLVQAGTDIKNYYNDVRAAKDGSLSSLANADMWKDSTATAHLGTQQMYSPNTDNLDILASKISNRSRVYKGGSWKDRAYWLNPSQRRYLDQGKCTDDIGFRCAMSRIGGEAQ